MKLTLPSQKSATCRRFLFIQNLLSSVTRGLRTNAGRVLGSSQYDAAPRDRAQPPHTHTPRHTHPFVLRACSPRKVRLTTRVTSGYGDTTCSVADVYAVVLKAAPKALALAALAGSASAAPKARAPKRSAVVPTDTASPVSAHTLTASAGTSTRPLARYTFKPQEGSLTRCGKPMTEICRARPALRLPLRRLQPHPLVATVCPALPLCRAPLPPRPPPPATFVCARTRASYRRLVLCTCAHHVSQPALSPAVA